MGKVLVVVNKTHDIPFSLLAMTKKNSANDDETISHRNHLMPNQLHFFSFSFYLLWVFLGWLFCFGDIDISCCQELAKFLWLICAKAFTPTIDSDTKNARRQTSKLRLSSTTGYYNVILLDGLVEGSLQFLWLWIYLATTKISISRENKDKGTV